MGTGDVKAGLTDRYELHHISGAFDKQYNSHNQYLETLLALGMIGLVMLLLTFIFPVLTLKSDIKPVFMFFLLLVGLNFQVESMLNRQAGVMFFAFFYSFLSVNNSSNSGRRGENLIKFCFDRFFALIGLILLLVPGLIIGCLIKSNSNGPVFYTQIRIGFKGKQFRMIKFRTMHPNEGSSVSVSTDPRITPFGRILRRWKLDELPELWNIFTGEMSFVGPRPDVPGFADKLEGEERKILLLRPGLTGPASIKYSNEEYILSKVKNPEEYNLNVIWPDKVKINLDYYHKHNLWIDITYIMQTFISKSEKIE